VKSPKPLVSRQITAPASPRCSFSYSDGRRCRMLCRPPHLTLCPFHAREELQLLEAQDLAASFATRSGGLYTYNDVNAALCKLFRAVAANRLPPRSAAIMAYIGQLLLQSLPPLEREYNLARGRHAWEDRVADVYYAYVPAAAEPEDDSSSDPESGSDPGPGSDSGPGTPIQ